MYFRALGIQIFDALKTWKKLFTFGVLLGSTAIGSTAIGYQVAVWLYPAIGIRFLRALIVETD